MLMATGTSRDFEIGYYLCFIGEIADKTRHKFIGKTGLGLSRNLFRKFFAGFYTTILDIEPEIHTQ